MAPKRKNKNSKRWRGTQLLETQSSLLKPNPLILIGGMFSGKRILQPEVTFLIFLEFEFIWLITFGLYSLIFFSLLFCVELVNQNGLFILLHFDFFFDTLYINLLVWSIISYICCLTYTSIRDNNILRVQSLVELCMYVSSRPVVRNLKP